MRVWSGKVLQLSSLRRIAIWHRVSSAAHLQRARAIGAEAPLRTSLRRPRLGRCFQSVVLRHVPRSQGRLRVSVGLISMPFGIGIREGDSKDACKQLSEEFDHAQVSDDMMQVSPGTQYSSSRPKGVNFWRSLGCPFS